MARSRRASRLAFSILSAAAVAGICILVFKGGSNTPANAASGLQPHEAGPALAAPATPVSEATLTKRDDAARQYPTTSIGSAPSTQPTKLAPNTPTDPEGIFKLATVKRDAGDLVTARDLLNNALASATFTGSDAQDAKTFIGALNDKIILGTQKFPADPYNKTWKVEPGTVLVKLAKRFDVTAELLCKVNGLSRPDRLKAGVTIKTIQGPFHLVVSKSRFEADIYLGHPGGEGSMYVKTVRVGLGSDGSTPTGTWQVDTGKVVDPVYYSPRGEGVIAANDPKNPLGERWIPLKGIDGDCVGKESYGIHGTIDPDSIGKNMSMGCIRLADEDIKLLYDLLIEGKSLVKVVD